jgi:16S rRNA processing protein RimM
MPADTIAVGRIRGAWGIAGGFKVEPFNSLPDSVLRTARRWWLVPVPERETGVRAGLPAGAVAREFRITRCRVHSDALVAQAQGVADRTAAEALKGLEVHVSRADFPKPAEGEYYWIDLIGCAVRGQDDAALGLVSAIDDHGAHPILSIVDGERERLVPFVGHYIVAVDLEIRLIRVDWHADW